MKESTDASMIQTLNSAIRGFLIGVAEIIPGVSGGTIALITGIFDPLIKSAGHLVRSVTILARHGFKKSGRPLAKIESDQVQWRIVLPAGIGMLIGIFAGAKAVAPLIEQYPTLTSALFFGLILASLWIPIRMVGSHWNTKLVLVTIIFAVLSFLLTGIPAVTAQETVPLPFVALAAAVAVCALVLPGVSGSFILLLIGVYGPTLQAVNDRNWVYLLVFILGAIIGLSVFVSLLQWLLEHRRGITLAIMTGLMLGSLRALWPWQAADRTLEAPSTDWLPALLIALAGIVVIVMMIVAENIVTKKRATLSA